MSEAAIQQTINRYLHAYNNFDVDGMLALLHPDITFENYTENVLTLQLKGLEEFRKQAEAAKQYFSQREQSITRLTIAEHTAEAQISYTAILAKALPNGLQPGDKLQLKGRSVFTFENDSIIRLQDYS